MSLNVSGLTAEQIGDVNNFINRMPKGTYTITPELKQEYKQLFITGRSKESEVLEWISNNEEQFKILLVTEFRYITYNGDRAIHFAARNRHATLVSLLISKYKVDPNTTNDIGETPLHLATYNGDTEMVKILLEAKANPNFVDDCNSEDDNTPLHLATIEGHTSIVKLLLEAGANLNVRNVTEQTPLYLASCNGHTEVVKLLLEAKAEPNVSNIYDGQTPLCIASSDGLIEIVHSLLKAGADPNLANIKGKTPLQLAFSNSNMDVVKLLLEAGANDIPIIVTVSNGDYTSTEFKINVKKLFVDGAVVDTNPKSIQALIEQYGVQ